MTIIGRKDLIPHFKHKRHRAERPKTKVSERYDRRQIILSKLGYASYAEYLRSDDWAIIRSRVLSAWPTCLMCDRPARQVHHVKYFDSVFLGLDDTRLAALCGQCHERIEVKDGEKTRMGQANCELFEAARKTKHGQCWLAKYHGTPGRPRGRS
jgi:hypothetical protein